MKLKTRELNLVESLSVVKEAIKDFNKFKEQYWQNYKY